MKEIVCVKLENDMDLILAHKRAMKLCELTGFSLIAQTSIATAVSEIARCAIEYGQHAELILAIEAGRTTKVLKAVIQDTNDFGNRCSEATQYAKRLVDEVEISKSGKMFQIILKQRLVFPGTVTAAKIDSLASYFKNEPPLSAYDELRRKNLQLQEFAEKLRESENEYRVLTDSLPLMMFSLNNRGVITYSNKWLQNNLGSDLKDVGSSWQTIVHPEDYSRFNKELTNAMTRQIALSADYRLKEKNSDKYSWHLLSINPLKNERDIAVGWIGFIVDVNAQKVVEQTIKDNLELKETQRQLIENQEELERKVVELNRSNYELEQFAHLASHDLQEPLRKLFFYSDMLKNKYASVVDENAARMFNNMTLAAARMKELIDDLLSYSQLQKQNMKIERVELNEIFHDILKDMEISIREKGAIVKVDELPSLDGNALRLRQLFTNLVSNALKYSKKGVTPEVEVSGDVDGENIKISVKDNGIGFEEKYSEMIFGLFQRLHTKSEIPGTGIGLSICRKIADMHRGSITASSVPGEYSVFEVSLPLSSHQTTAAR